MKVPDFFRIKSAKEQSNSIPLKHDILTSSDFFMPRPILAREVLPNDDFRVEIKSFCRMLPMPFPTFGHIKFYNRAFFVPNRLIMEGWLNFKEDIPYPTPNSFVSIQSVPWVANNVLASYLHMESMPSNTYLYVRPLFTKPDEYGTGYPFAPLVDNTGQIFYFDGDDGDLWFCVNTLTGQIRLRQGWTGYSAWTSAFGKHLVGSYTNSSANYYCVTDMALMPGYDPMCFHLTSDDPYNGEFVAAQVSSTAYEVPEISDQSYDENTYDYMFGAYPYVFGDKARNFYKLLISLGYRVNFSTEVTQGTRYFSITEKYSALKLLAFVKVYLDYYTPSQYQLNNTLCNLFVGVSSTGREITSPEIASIASIKFGNYERDYFTSAWQNPSVPNENGSQSQYDIRDISVDGTYPTYSSVINFEKSSIASTQTSIGSTNGTPTIFGDRSGVVAPSQAPYNLSYYILEQLRALTTFMRRHQLAGYRPIDRYLAENGIKLDDDRSQRCYFLGSDQFDASIQDIMSTSDTQFAALGEYAGKGLAYGERDGIRLQDCKENGIFIIINSIVPDIGYVQGVNRENLHLRRMDFFQGDFDNLGTQPIMHQELIADGKMKAFGSNEPIDTFGPQKIFGFAPRYIEYKIGADFLTGDFAIPSRRTGMDSFHLFRLFDDGIIQSIDKSFVEGENEQYDRIFNNTDPSYDHFRLQHRVMIYARRAMKSASEVYEFEHADGQSITVPANGTQLV